MNKKGIDLLNGPIIKNIILFALPLAASSMLQQLFNSADVAIVGQFAGSKALGAVGANAAIINLLVNLFTGLSIGANVVIASYIGQDDKKRVNQSIHTSLFISMICGLVLMFIGVFFSKFILQLVSTPNDILDLADIYLKIYFLGMPFIMGYNFLSAIYRSKGDTKTPLYVLTLAGIVNVVLNLFFVVVLKMSVAGVALATVLSNVLSSTILLYKLTQLNNEFKVTIKNIKCEKELLKKIIQIGFPAGLQGMMYSIANVIVQASLNGLGSLAVAASSAALNYEYLTYFVLASFGQAAVTFLGQNYAAQKYERCKNITKATIVLGCASTCFVSMLFVVLQSPFASVFTTDAQVLKYACLRMQIILPFQIFNAANEILSGCMRGLGYSSLPALICVGGICGIRLGYIYFIYPMINTYTSLMYVYPISWIITTMILAGAMIYVQRQVYQK